MFTLLNKCAIIYFQLNIKGVVLMAFITCPVKYDDSKCIIYDPTLRRIIFDLANADNCDDEDYEPEYRQEKIPDYSKIWKSKNKG